MTERSKRKFDFSKGLFIHGGSKKSLQENVDKLKIKVREKIVDEVLEIIDEENDLSKLVEETPLGCGVNDTLAQNIKNRVLALKVE